MTDVTNPAGAADAQTTTTDLASAAAPAPAADGPIQALVVCNGKVPKKPTQPIVVVAESRADDGQADTIAYGAGGTAYLRFTPDLDMGCPADVLFTLGENVQQFAFFGLSPYVDSVNVGPAHPAHAAVNLAYNQGARVIEVAGLSAAWKERLSPYIARINDEPAYGVSVTLT